MSVAYHEEEPVDEWQGFCNVHGFYYDHSTGCAGCKDEHFDRDLQDHQDDRGRDGGI